MLNMTFCLVNLKNDIDNKVTSTLNFSPSFPGQCES